MQIKSRGIWGLAASASIAATLITAAAASASSAAKATTVSLKRVCPSTVKIQQNWTPEVEQSAYYQLAASGGTINSSQKTYTAALLDPATGGRTGVKVELLAGGPAVGYSSPEQLLYEDQSILIGVDATDTQIEAYAKTPTVGIVTPMDRYDNIYFWSPSAHHFTTISQFAGSGATLLSFGSGGALNLYLEAKGWLNKSQIDGSYNGTPGDFVASGGTFISGGYATYEPYFYTHQLAAWDKPVDYMLIANTGYDPYSNTTFVTPTSLKKYSSCLKKLVPMIQEAQLAYLQQPARINKMIVGLDAAYKIGGGYSLGVAKYAQQTMLADRIMSQEGAGGFASFNMARVNRLIGQLKATNSVTGLPSNFSATTLETNKFIDNKIKMRFYKGPYNNVHGVITEQ
jgi:hypothetical protein